MDSTKEELAYLNIYLTFIEENSLDELCFMSNYFLDNLDDSIGFKYINKSELSSYLSEIKMLK